jgi:hypothetical protein
MNIKTHWGQRKESYPGQFGLELLAAWDENSMDANEGGFEEEVALQQVHLNSQFESFRVIDIDVSDALLFRAFRTPKIPGHVQTPPQNKSEDKN